jgi:hypothetical protein
MGIKAYFGKSIASMLQAHQDKVSHTLASGSQIRAATDMERMFGNCAPAVVAFRIDNGFVVRTVDMRHEMEGHMQGGFHYCKDHQEIAEHIIASEAKRKLGLGEQREMFAERAYQAQNAVLGSGGFAQAKRATNRI